MYTPGVTGRTGRSSKSILARIEERQHGEGGMAHEWYG
jgi:hypothetical protein